MDAERKRELAEKVVDLTVMNRISTSATMNGVPDPEIVEKHRSRMRKEQTELYLKHYEPEQFVALLDFYNTDIGKSILESQKNVSDDMASGMRLASVEVREGSPGSIFRHNQSHEKPENQD